MNIVKLPEKVSPIFSFCPYTNVFLFVSEHNLLLCRRSGKLVWSIKRYCPDEVKSITWSLDKLYFALVYSTGKYSVHSVSSGRVSPEFVLDSKCAEGALNVTCVEWSDFDLMISDQQNIDEQLNSNQNLELDTNSMYVSDNWGPKKSIISQTDPTRFLNSNIVPSLIPQVPALEATLNAHCINPSISIAASDSGSVLIKLRRSLELPEIEMPLKDPVHSVTFNERIGEFACAQKNLIYVYRAEEIASKDFCKISALVKCKLLMEQTCSLWDTISESCENYRQLNVDFFKPLGDSYSDAKFLLMKAILGGLIAPETTEWIKFHHEQGFIRWYKRSQASMILVIDELKNRMIPLIEEIMQQYQFLGYDQKLLSTLLMNVFELLEKSSIMYTDFQYVAPYIQYLFVEETDRPIAITDLKDCKLEYSIHAISFSFFEDWKFDPALEKLRPKFPEALAYFKGVLSENCTYFKEYFKPTYTAQLPSNITALKFLKRGEYAVILDNNQTAHVKPDPRINIDEDSSGVQIDLGFIEGEKLRFSGLSDTIVSLDKENQKVIYNNKDIKLDIDPEEIATRVDGTNVIACILASDCRQFQVIDL